MNTGYYDTPEQERSRWELMKKHAAEREAAKQAEETKQPNLAVALQ